MSEIDSLPGLLPLTDLDELERVAIELGAWGDAVRFVAATNPDRPAFQQQPDSHLLFPAPRGQANGHQRRHDRAALRPHARPHASRSRDIPDAIGDGFGRNLDATPTAVHHPSDAIPLNQAEDDEAL